MIPLSPPSSSIGLLFLSLFSASNGIAISFYGFFHMQDDSYHTFASDDDKDYYDKSLEELKQGYTKVYRGGYRCPCDPRNEAASYSIVLKHAEHFAINSKRPHGREQHRAIAEHLKNIPWKPFVGKDKEYEVGPLKKNKVDKM